MLTIYSNKIIITNLTIYSQSIQCLHQLIQLAKFNTKREIIRFDHLVVRLSENSNTFAKSSRISAQFDRTEVTHLFLCPGPGCHERECSNDADNIVRKTSRAVLPMPRQKLSQSV